MLNIGNKKYRNMPEQVAYNTEQIDKIFEFLDGLNVEDNLIVLEDASGTLNAEEMAIVSRNVAFIIYNDNLYIKTETSASEFVFKQINLNVTDNGTYNVIQSYKIIVTRASGAYSYFEQTILTTYNKSELDALLVLKANLSGADFSGPVTAQTLKQNEANWKADFPTFPNITGGTSSPIFCRVQQINQELHIVMLGKVVNNSGADISAYTLSFISFDLPTSIANKIYDVLGNKVSDIIANNVRVTYNPAGASLSDASDMSKFIKNVEMIVLNNTSANRISISFQCPSQITIHDGETLYLESRVSLDLI